MGNGSVWGKTPGGYAQLYDGDKKQFNVTGADAEIQEFMPSAVRECSGEPEASASEGSNGASTASDSSDALQSSTLSTPQPSQVPELPQSQTKPGRKKKVSFSCYTAKIMNLHNGIPLTEDSDDECDVCRGTGEVQPACPKCDGTGESHVIRHQFMCTQCKGRGSVFECGSTTGCEGSKTEDNNKNVICSACNMPWQNKTTYRCKNLFPYVAFCDFRCDVCVRRDIKKGEKMMSCRQCAWDVCWNCKEQDDHDAVDYILENQYFEDKNPNYNNDCARCTACNGSRMGCAEMDTQTQRQVDDRLKKKPMCMWTYNDFASFVYGFQVLDRDTKPRVTWAGVGDLVDTILQNAFDGDWLIETLNGEDIFGNDHHMSKRPSSLRVGLDLDGQWPPQGLEVSDNLWSGLFVTLYNIYERQDDDSWTPKTWKELCAHFEAQRSISTMAILKQIQERSEGNLEPAQLGLLRHWLKALQLELSWINDGYPVSGCSRGVIETQIAHLQTQIEDRSEPAVPQAQRIPEPGRTPSLVHVRDLDVIPMYPEVTRLEQEFQEKIIHLEYSIEADRDTRETIWNDGTSRHVDVESGRRIRRKVDQLNSLRTEMNNATRELRKAMIAQDISAAVTVIPLPVCHLIAGYAMPIRS